MMPEQQPSEFWQDKAEEEAKLTGTVTEENFTIPLGATHHAIYPQTNAVLALVLAIMSFACCGLIWSIPALIIALGAKKIIDFSPYHPDAGTAQVAYIASIVNIVLSIVVILGYIAVMIVYVI